MTAHCKACGHTDCGHPDPIWSGTCVIDDGHTTGSDDGGARHLRDTACMRGDLPAADALSDPEITPLHSNEVDHA